MRYEGFVPEKSNRAKIFTEAVAFARKRGKLTLKGLFLKQFTHGTFAQYKQHIMWFEGKRVREVQSFLEEQIGSRTLE